MTWTEEHDKILCREILCVDPFTGTKKKTVQRGAKWKEVAVNLMAISEPKFKVDVRGVRDRYNLLAQRLRAKLKEEERASGVDTDMSETETALEEIIEKEDAADDLQESGCAQKRRNKEAEKETAESMRNKAMERLGQTQKGEGGDEGSKKKKRSNGNDTLLFLREKNEMMEGLKREEMELKKKEMELEEKKHSDFMKLMLAQQQQQAQQMQDFQAMMVGIMSKFGSK